jgi:hypothetical protein
MSFRYQTVKITVANATAAASLDKKETLLSEMDKVTGVAVYQHSTKNGGATAKRLSLKMGTTVLQDLTTVDDYLVTTAIPPNERFKNFDFPAQGQQIVIGYDWDAAMAADWEIHVVFRCEK